MHKRLGYLSAAPRVSTLPSANEGGPRAHVLGVIAAFEGMGWQVPRFIVGDRHGDRLAKSRPEKMFRAQPWKLFLLDILRMGLNITNGRAAVREIGTDQVDFVYERLALFQALGVRFQRRGVPWVLESNAILYHEAAVERKAVFFTETSRRREMAAYRGADLVVAVSEDLKALIVKESGVDPSKVYVMANAVDTARLDPVRHPHVPAPDDRMRVVFVGAMHVWQGLELLVRAVHRLRGQGRNITLEFAGDGQALAPAQALATELGLGEHAKFHGRIGWDRIPPLLAGSDIGYSGQEPLDVGKMYHSPLKLYEYSAMALPFIASDYPDARKLSNDGARSFLFAAGNLDSLVAALDQAWAKRSDLRAMGAQLRTEIQEHHGWAARVRELLVRLEPILAKNRAQAKA